jgi:phage shock protein C
MKKIYRLKKEQKIAGICAGFGEMYSIDPTILRIAVVFGTVATAVWPGIIAYIAGWILIPYKEDFDENTGNGQ